MLFHLDRRYMLRLRAAEGLAFVDKGQSRSHRPWSPGNLQSKRCAIRRCSRARPVIVEASSWGLLLSINLRLRPALGMSIARKNRVEQVRLTRHHGSSVPVAAEKGERLVAVAAAG